MGVRKYLVRRNPPVPLVLGDPVLRSPRPRNPRPRNPRLRNPLPRNPLVRPDRVPVPRRAGTNLRQRNRRPRNPLPKNPRVKNPLPRNPRLRNPLRRNLRRQVPRNEFFKALRCTPCISLYLFPEILVGCYAFSFDLLCGVFHTSY